MLKKGATVKLRLTMLTGHARVIAARGSQQSERAAETGIESVKQNAPAAAAQPERKKPRPRQAMERVTTS